MSRTQLVYQGDTYLFNLTARVLSFKSLGEGKSALILDRTIFYPQGGGQPSDVGKIRSKLTDACLLVTMVKRDQETEQVEHEGKIEINKGFSIGEEVDLTVDETTRLLHSRIHSGGHLLDHAIQLLNIPLHGTKGYHFPSGPYVEYMPTADLDVTPSGLESLKKSIQEKAREMITEKRTITVQTCPPSELNEQILSTLPEKARLSDVVRMIHFEGAPLPGPCGGTHVQSTAEIGEFSIKKVSCKNNIIRISYICA